MMLPNKEETVSVPIDDSASRARHWASKALGDEEVFISMESQLEGHSGKGVGLFPFALEFSDASNGLQDVHTCYLVRTWAERTEEAHVMLVSLARAAMTWHSRSCVRTVRPETWNDLRLPAQPAFVLLLPERWEGREETTSPTVREALHVETVIPIRGADAVGVRQVRKTDSSF